MIPILDYSKFRQPQDGKDGAESSEFVAALANACRDTGFFLLTGHGIDPRLIARCFRQAEALFALDSAAKDEMSILNSPHNRGYARTGSESLDETSGQMDMKEAFNIGLDLAADDPRVLAGEPYRGVNLWPDLPEFRSDLLDYFNAAWALGVDLHRSIALDLGLDEHWFAGHFDAPMATLRLLHYPPGNGAVGAIGAGAHSDYGSITLLVTDGVPGLQVRPRGQDWIDVPHVDGAFVVNIGDCLMRWSNDIYTSTPHRVLPPERERYSLAFFLDPNPDTIISALPGTGDAHYPPISAADYLTRRLTATYAKEAD